MSQSYGDLAKMPGLPETNNEHPSVEDWEQKDQRIIVSTPAGFLFQLQLNAKIDATPDEVFDVLVDPEPHRIFRGIKGVTYRRIVQDNGKGGRKLEVGHKSFVKFLWFAVPFETHLVVWEDAATKTIHFQNAHEGFMKKFDGRWQLRPFCQESLDSLSGQTSLTKNGHVEHRSTPFDVLSKIFRVDHHPPVAQSTLVTLEQAILPRAVPPGAMQHLVRKLCANTIQGMMEDLRREVDRRKEDKKVADEAAFHCHEDTLAVSGQGTSSKRDLQGVAVAACLTSSSCMMDSLSMWIKPLAIIV